MAMNLQEIKKELINAPFKTAFKATMGFYLAQFAATTLGLVVFGLVIFTIALLLGLV
jgi:hypothetical protein